MSLTAADIAEILRLVEASSFDELSLEFNGLKLNFKRGAGGEGRAESPASPAEPGSTPPVAATPAAAAKPASSLTGAAVADANLLAVRSPMLGTFYRAPKPGSAPFVEAGSQVEEDTIIGIIEVMKLMNTVRAQVRGTVAEILAADGSLVEYDEILLRVRKPV